MAAKNGRIEATITVAAGGWTADLVGTGSGTATIPAGDYFLSELLAEVATQWSATTGDTVTATLDGGESGTGAVTIASSATLAVTWTNNFLRDALGFAAGLSGADTYESPNHAKAVWLPDCVKFTRRGDGVAGLRETDGISAEGPGGNVYHFVSASKTVNAIRWDFISRSRAVKEGEELSGESFESFWEDCILGELAFVETGATLRVYWDADSSALGNEHDYRIAGESWRAFAALCTPVREGWVGGWTIELERLVEQT
jgi:hypothetical protein